MCVFELVLSLCLCGRTEPEGIRSCLLGSGSCWSADQLAKALLWGALWLDRGLPENSGRAPVRSYEADANDARNCSPQSCSLSSSTCFVPSPACAARNSATCVSYCANVPSDRPDSSTRRRRRESSQGRNSVRGGKEWGRKGGYRG